MIKEHSYTLSVTWTGNTGKGTLDYRSYERSHTIMAQGKEPVEASADPVFRGDKTKYNPEELLLASLSSCHMLWFLHLCAESGVVVVDYTDQPTGIMEETDNGGGRFKDVTLHPTVTVTELSALDKLDNIHNKAHKLCFIANSVNFDVKHNPTGKTV